MFACLYVPNFAAEAVMRSESAALRKQPVAILDGTPPLVRVFAVNERARQAGVEIGMTKLQAEALPGIVLRQRSRLQEAAAHAALVDCCCALSPRIEEAADDTILLDIAGLERIFGPPAAIARELARRVADVGMEANIAAAANIEAAIHAARGFSGLTVIAPGEEADRLGPRPIEVLVSSFTVPSTEYRVPSKELRKCGTPSPPRAKAARAGDAGTAELPNCIGAENQFGNPANDQRPKTKDRRQKQQQRSCEQYKQELLDTFDRWGVRTFRALALLPPVAVAERLGQDGITLQKLARGEGLRTLAPTEPPLKFAEALELEYPVENLEPLAFILNRLLEQLCARLEARSLATNELRLTLELDDIADRQIGPSEDRIIGTTALASYKVFGGARLQSCRIATTRDDVFSR
jgi:nucleotidyltransferase/DNA polymerase involved in DNA repair